MEPRPGPEDATTSRHTLPSPRNARYIPSAPKVSQIDAGELDEGLVHMLGERLERAVGNFQAISSVNVQPEINLILKLVLFRLSFGAGGGDASPGSRLVNLRLVHGLQGSRVPPRLLLLYLLLHPPIFPSYLLSRLRGYALSKQWPDLPPHDWRRKAWKAVIRLENAARAWELAGWGWFLWDGQYPSLLMRILKLRLVPISSRVTRLVSYEFMNRQLVWSAFTDFLLFSIPLLPTLPASFRPSALIRPVRTLLTRPAKIDYSSLPLLPSSTLSGGISGPTKNGKARAVAVHTGPFAHLPLSTCPICRLRNSSVPVPIDRTGAASGIALPPIHVQPADTAGGNMGEGDDADGDGDGIDDEERIFVPAQTDCRGGCRWCYYCIGRELGRHFERVAEKNKGNRRGGLSGTIGGKGKGKKGDGARAREKLRARRRGGSQGGIKGDDKRKEEDEEEEQGEQVEPWECLRCGGEVRRAWRVGAKDLIGFAGL